LTIAPPSPPPSSCSIGRWYGTLEQPDRDRFDTAIGAIVDQRERLGGKYPSGYTAGWLHGELKANGVLLDLTSLQRHIRRDCRCG
jgi:hypothetical protein